MNKIRLILLICVKRNTKHIYFNNLLVHSLGEVYWKYYGYHFLYGDFIVLNGSNWEDYMVKIF